MKTKFPLDITGLRFGRLLVIEKSAENKYGRDAYKCICDCGNHVTTRKNSLRRGDTKSCGCLKRDLSSARLRKHGCYKTPEYSIWEGIIKRTTNPADKAFKDYGGRGISVCERWRTFTNFLADMGIRPSGMSIDRINNDGNYEPGNCRWSTKTQQSENSRAARLITVNGITKNISGWARETGIKYITIHRRLQAGWSPERALQPVSR